MKGNGLAYAGYFLCVILHDGLHVYDDEIGTLQWYAG
jgi:hypothetical protein